MSGNGKAHTANPYRGETALVIGGKERRLRFGLNAGVRLQQETGLTLKEAFDALANLDLIVLRGVIWAGLGDPDLSAEAVGDMVDGDMEAGAYTLADIATAAARALEASFGRDDAKKGGKPKGETEETEETEEPETKVQAET